MKSPILEHRYGDKAVINPEDLVKYIENVSGRKRPKLPRYALFTFWQYMLDEAKKEYGGRRSFFLGKPRPFQLFKYKDIKVALLGLPFSAPSSGAFVDLMFSLGTEYAIFFGSCGVLDPGIERSSMIVPSKALRDEGTSYHYEKPSRYSYPSRDVLNCIERTLKDNHIKYQKGATWTTDALFRETKRKVREYRREGCIAVDMEAAAFFSIAKFRKKHIGAIFCAADCVGGREWDPRRTRGAKRRDKTATRQVLRLSLETLNCIHNDL
jgi:uridine phosphorylase